MSDGRPADVELANGDEAGAEEKEPAPREAKRPREEDGSYRQVQAHRKSALFNQITIDWLSDLTKYRRFTKYLYRQNIARGWLGRALNIYNAMNAYVVLVAVAVCTAVTGAFMTATSEWLSNLKNGYCQRYGFWVDRSACCFESLSEECDSFTSWGEALGAPYGVSTLIDFTMYVAMGTCMAGACGWLVCSFAPMAAGSGLAQLKTILGGFIIRKFLGGWTLLVKSIGLVLSVSSALVAGKEGPMVHIACCWGNLISRCFSKYSWNEAKKREIVSSSAAAGIAVAFGAPIGGVLYSLEELSSYFPHKTMLRAFFCAIAAKLIYIYINPLPTGKSVQFAVQSKLNEWEWFDMFFFILLGVLGGVVGAFFVKFNLRIYKLRQSRQWLRSNPLRQVVGVAFVTCVLSYFNVFMRDNMLQLLEHLFSRCDPSIDVDDLDGVTAALCRRDNDGLQIFSLILAGVLKMVLLVFTFGLMVPVGLFIPSLASGACLGRALGMSILLWHESVGTSFPFTACVGRSPTLCVSPRVYAIVGAAGMLAGVMRITVSLVVIMLEVTGGLEYVLPVMIAVTVAKWVGDAISGEGISDAMSRANGYPFIDPKAEVDCEGTAADIMTPDPVFFTVYGSTVASVREALEAHTYHGFVIVRSERERVVYGYISRVDLELALDEAAKQGVTGDASGREIDPSMRRLHFSTEPPSFAVSSSSFVDVSSYVDRHPIVIDPTTPADRVADLFIALGVSLILVADAGRLQGIIKKKDLILYMEHVATESPTAGQSYQALSGRDEKLLG